MAHLEIGTFGESQGYLAFRSNYLEDGAKGVTTAVHLSFVKSGLSTSERRTVLRKSGDIHEGPSTNRQLWELV